MCTCEAYEFFSEFLCVMVGLPPRCVCVRTHRDTLCHLGLVLFMFICPPCVQGYTCVAYVRVMWVRVCVLVYVFLEYKGRVGWSIRTGKSVLWCLPWIREQAMV